MTGRDCEREAREMMPHHVFNAYPDPNWNPQWRCRRNVVLRVWPARGTKMLAEFGAPTYAACLAALRQWKRDGGGRRA